MGAPFLLYLYYDFEDKPALFKLIWKLTDLLRLNVISKLPPSIKKIICSIIAIIIYYPLARFSRLLEIFGINVENLPLSDYRNKSFYIMNNDALDRFGTKLEQRFSKKDITNMLKNSGFHKITFSNKKKIYQSKRMVTFSELNIFGPKIIQNVSIFWPSD